MLYEIAKEITSRLKARGYPLEVRFDEDGFIRSPGTTTENLALISYSDSGDDLSPPVGVGGNGKIVLRCDTGVEILVMGVSNVSGARPHEHKRVCIHHRNAVLCELVSVIQERKNAWGHLSGGFVAPPDGTVSEYGARYLITCAIAIGIARPAADVVPANTLGGVETTTTIKTPGLEDSIETCTTTPEA